MKIYYISSGLQGCYAVRCLHPLVANGWDGDQTSLSLDQISPENKSKAAQESDVVVFHRPDDPEKLKLARILKDVGKKIVYDNDDTFKDDGGFKFNEYLNEERLKTGLKRINEVLDAFITEADLVTCSTEFLKKEYEKLNKNVVVLPNCVDPFYFDEPLKNKGQKVRIGVTGSIAVTSDLEALKPIIEHYQHDPRVQLVLFSLPPKNHDKLIREMYADEYAFLDSVNLEWQPFVDMQNYYDTLNELRLDMMIIPRADTYFNRCKSNLKFLEASMFEIPVIAQGFEDGNSPYQGEEDSKYMKIAFSTDDWIKSIDELTVNKNLRETMGKRAHAYVKEKYDIEKNAYKWEEAYKSLYA